jgi:hypothetical protein
MNMRRTVVVGLLIAAGACSGDGELTPKGGGAFEASMSANSAARYPSIVARAFGRTVNNAAVTDSIVGEVLLVKQLEGRARYQFYLVNGLDSSAIPVSHRQWLVRSDTALDANGNVTVRVDTNRSPGIRDFWRGGFFATKLRFAVTLSATDSAQQRGSWLILTIQPDSTRTAFNDSTGRPLFIRFRDQRGTVTRDDDLISPDTLRGRFGDFISPSRQVIYAPSGSGSLLFWDVAENGQPAMRVDMTSIPKPPRGYYYQPMIIDSLSGIAYAWGSVFGAGGTSLTNADVDSNAVLPIVRAIQGSSVVIGKPQDYTSVDLLLEPKGAPPARTTGLAIYSTMNAYRAVIPEVLRSKRAALGTVQAVVTRGTQGGAPAPNIGVVVQGPGSNFATLLGNKNSDSTGTARFTGVPPGEVRVLAIPFGGSVVEGRVTVVSGQTAIIRLVVP